MSTVEEQYGALTEGAGVVELADAGLLSLTGSDRLTFLQAKVSNDLCKLEPGQGCRAWLLTAKGIELYFTSTREGKLIRTVRGRYNLVRRP